MIGEAALRALLDAMTPDEKAAQLVQLYELFFDGEAGDATGPLGELRIRPETVAAAGSVLGSSGAARLRRLQDAYLAKARLKIPLLFMTDVIHGLATVFPVPLALGGSFDPELVRRTARAAAEEASAAGLHVTFSPMCDFARDPRWGRITETTGESAWLNGLYAAAMVRGYQGVDLADPRSLAACAKHFAGYGAVEGGREYDATDVSERTLREHHLPAFRAAVDAGVALVMPAFTLVDGVPAAASPWLLRTVLREEMGFEGVVVSDWGAVAELLAHGVAADRAEAAAKALAAGVDVEMMSSCYANHLAPLLAEGRARPRLVDEAVLRILRLKDRLGLFEDPHHGADEARERDPAVRASHRELAREAAARCLVLLRNDGVLPLAPDVRRVAVVGPYAEAAHLLGAWAADGRDEDCTPLAEALRRRLGADRVLSAAGCGARDEDPLEAGALADVLAAVRSADAVVLAVGEHPSRTGEAASRTDLSLPGRQRELCEAVLAEGKPTAVVLYNGRPLVLPDAAREAPALLEAWFPGTAGGEAVADVLAGDREPGGRLPVSFPASVGQIPVHHDRLPSGRPSPNGFSDGYQVGYRDASFHPAFPFGHGLAYTEFRYGEPSIDRPWLVAGAEGPEAEAVVSVDVTNAGARTGSEVVQLYLRDPVASVSRPLLEFKGFERVVLAPGETRRVAFRIGEPMLRFLGPDLRPVSEPGAILAFVGSSAARLSPPVAFELRPPPGGAR